MALIRLLGATKGFNDRVLFKDADFELADGERVGLVGRNGCGKSSLLKILAGVDPPDEGSLKVGQGVRVGYLEQAPELDPSATIREVVRGGLVGRDEVLREIDEVHGKMASAEGDALERSMKRLDALERRLESLGGHDVEHRIEATVDALGLADPDAPCGPLSGGERRRVALARLLVGRPDVMLLDEPTNHLDAFVTDWLEDWLLETRIPLVIVTHDRYMLERVVDRIVEIDRGVLHSYPGGYSDFLEGRADRIIAEERAESARLVVLRRETAWIRRGPPARTTKSKARIQRYDALVDAAPELAPADLEFQIPPGPRLGARVVTLLGVSKSWGDRQVLAPFDLELEPGMRLGVVGPNGAGKSTFVRILSGDLEADGGTREVGSTVSFMGIDQERSALDGDLSVAENVGGKQESVRIGDRSVRIEGFLDGFGFDARMRNSPVKTLSGGERNRVMLAKLLLEDGNLLVLDEPTNDLDLATLRALEEALLVFPGAAVLVSHDRWFLDRVATHVLYIDGEGGTRLHHGDAAELIHAVTKEREAKRLEDARRARAESAESRAAEAPAEAAEGSPAKKKRLTPWQEKELGEVEQSIASLEEEIAGLDERLASGELWQAGADPGEAKRVQTERTEKQERLDGLYGRWEELEALRS